MQQKRLEYLDFIKGVSIFMVTFCHQVIIPHDSIAGAVLMQLVFSAVPCFMMCSGYVLLFRRESVKKSFGRAGQVYLILLVWKVLYLLYAQLFETVSFSPVQLITYLFLFGSLKGVETEHFWFLQAYLPTLLITPLLAPMFCDRKYGTVAAFTALLYMSNQFLMSANLGLQLIASRLGFGWFDLKMLGFIFPFGGEYSSMLVCFALGGVFRLLDEKEITQKTRFTVLCAAMAVLGLAGMLVVRYLQLGTFAWAGALMIAPYEWSSTLVMSFGIFGLLRRLGERKGLHWIGQHIGRNSMGIYYLHYPCLIFLMHFVYPHLQPALWMNFAKAVVVTAVCVLLVKGCKKIPVVRELMR